MNFSLNDEVRLLTHVISVISMERGSTSKVELIPQSTKSRKIVYYTNYSALTPISVIPDGPAPPGGPGGPLPPWDPIFPYKWKKWRSEDFSARLILTLWMIYELIGTLYQLVIVWDVAYVWEIYLLNSRSSISQFQNVSECKRKKAENQEANFNSYLL